MARPAARVHRGGHFQPSEWVKLILILAVAKYFADLHQRELSWPDFIKAGGIVLVPMLMVLRQPDLGTSLTYLPIAIAGLFLGGVRFKQAAIVTIAAALLLPLAWHALKPYQRDRLTSFMHPEADSQGSGYQVNQSLIAVGSGGIWGNSCCAAPVLHEFNRLNCINSSRSPAPWPRSSAESWRSGHRSCRDPNADSGLRLS